MKLSVVALAGALASGPVWADGICNTDFRLAGSDAIQAIRAACRPGDAITFHSPPAGLGHNPVDPAQAALCDPREQSIVQRSSRVVFDGFSVTCILRRR